MQSYEPGADLTSARHEYESDDEDVDYPPPSNSSQRMSASESTGDHNIDVKITCESRSGELPTDGLIIASNEAGSAWMAGVELGKAVGRVLVNDWMIGEIFVLAAATDRQVVVLASEQETSLPYWAMSTYASKILLFLKPKRVCILDTYPIASYRTATELPMGQIRYLSTNHSETFNEAISPFQPPNLLQNTSAAFIALSYPHSVQTVPTTVFLLPSYQGISEPPAVLQQTSKTKPKELSNWGGEILSVHNLLTCYLGAGDVKYRLNEYHSAIPGSSVFGEKRVKHNRDVEIYI